MAAEEDGLRLVSTDSYRLSVRDLAGTTILGEGQKVLVPSRALKELSRVVGDADEITLRLGERDAGFEVGPVKVTTRLIEGDFPNYRGLIPSNHPNALTVDRETLLDAVRRVRLLAQESTPVRLAMSSEGLELVAVTQDVGQAHEAVEASYNGDDLTVAFNPEYLIDGIEVAPGDEIILETVDELKPALLKSSGDPNFLYLLMPVRELTDAEDPKPVAHRLAFVSQFRGVFRRRPDRGCRGERPWQDESHRVRRVDVWRRLFSGCSR